MAFDITTLKPLFDTFNSGIEFIKNLRSIRSKTQTLEEASGTDYTALAAEINRCILTHPGMERDMAALWRLYHALHDKRDVECIRAAKDEKGQVTLLLRVYPDGSFEKATYLFFDGRYRIYTDKVPTYLR